MNLSGTYVKASPGIFEVEVLGESCWRAPMYRGVNTHYLILSRDRNRRPFATSGHSLYTLILDVKMDFFLCLRWWDQLEVSTNKIMGLKRNDDVDPSASSLTTSYGVRFSCWTKGRLRRSRTLPSFIASRREARRELRSRLFSGPPSTSS